MAARSRAAAGTTSWSKPRRSTASSLRRSSPSCYRRQVRSGPRSRPYRGPEMTSVDCWTLGSAVVTVAAFVWRMPHERFPTLLAIHLLLAVLVLLMPRARRAGPVGRFLGDWYPLLIVTALYTEVGLV